eukprot:820119-Alexandrium_andersonii.AAC.1
MLEYRTHKSQALATRAEQEFAMRISMHPRALAPGKDALASMDCGPHNCNWPAELAATPLTG